MANAEPVAAKMGTVNRPMLKAGTAAHLERPKGEILPMLGTRPTRAKFCGGVANQSPAALIGTGTGHDQASSNNRRLRIRLVHPLSAAAQENALAKGFVVPADFAPDSDQLWLEPALVPCGYSVLRRNHVG